MPLALTSIWQSYCQVAPVRTICTPTVAFSSYFDRHRSCSPPQLFVSIDAISELRTKCDVDDETKSMKNGRRKWVREMQEKNKKIQKRYVKTVRVSVLVWDGPRSPSPWAIIMQTCMDACTCTYPPLLTLSPCRPEQYRNQPTCTHTIRATCNEFIRVHVWVITLI